ncbi:beta-galactosidase trimerization domain-containing protein [Phycicoccus sp. CSK15P-2]|nr:beta-galactosidase trimerization domain-containing protein [Phycicoccus sp. CSK15P-2]
MALDDAGSGRIWSEHARVEDDVEVLHSYTSGPLASHPAVTRRPVGSGAAWYLGTLPDDATLGALLDRVLVEAGVAPAAEVPPGVEVTRRRSATGSWLFVLNHTDADCEVAVSGHDLVSRTDIGPVATVPARSAAVVREG